MTEAKLGPLKVERKTGREPLRICDAALDTTVLDFWRWSASDLSSNTTRGIVAEFIVACDLGVADGVRTEWGPWDLETRDGIKVEVKCSAYLQTWHQDRHSSIEFGIAPRHAWKNKTNTWSTEKKRWSDAYVFALLHHQDKATLDSLKLEQWTFYVVPTRILD